jgi:hypothetical protein
MSVSPAVDTHPIGINFAPAHRSPERPFNASTGGQTTYATTRATIAYVGDDMFRGYAERQSFDRTEFYGLWLFVAVTYGAGDVLTTMTIDASAGLVEANALVAAAMAQFGSAGLVALKIGVLLASIGISLYGLAVLRDRTVYYLPPLALACMGTFATAYNLVLLLF